MGFIYPIADYKVDMCSDNQRWFSVNR